MRVFVISDTHFGHNNLVKMGVRQSNFQEKIMRNWNRMVTADDLVIHLGDYIVCGGSEFYSVISQLKGRKVLVLGNHDKKSLAWYMNHGFSFACQAFAWHYHGKSILFTHEPYKLSGYDVNIHGHLHLGRHRKDYTLTDQHILFSMEERNYEPVLLNTLLEKGS